MNELFPISSKFAMLPPKPASSVFLLYGIVNHGDHILYNNLCCISRRLLSSPCSCLRRVINTHLSAFFLTFKPFGSFHRPCLNFSQIICVSPKLQNSNQSCFQGFASVSIEDGWFIPAPFLNSKIYLISEQSLETLSWSPHAWLFHIMYVTVTRINQFQKLFYFFSVVITKSNHYSRNIHAFYI